MLSGVLFAFGVALAVLYLPYCSAAIRWRRSIRKTLPVGMFALAAIMGGGPLGLSAALVFSALGDLALSRDSKVSFLYGMLAFAVAHLAYIYQMFVFDAAVLKLPMQGIALIFTLAVSTEFWLIPHTKDIKWPVRAYVGIIAVMGAVAMALPTGFEWAKLGAVLFIISDLILAIEIFRMTASHPMKKVAGKLVWITYISAQIGLFIGFANV